MIAVDRITYMEGTVSCPCQPDYHIPFAVHFDPPADPEEAEDIILDDIGWGETGKCPKCERQAVAERAADHARYQRKALSENLPPMPTQ